MIRRLKFLSILLVFTGKPLSASTFVGNGGSANDVEVVLSLEFIRKTFENYNRNEATELCRCSANMQEHKTCDTLKQLTEEQANYCAETLIESKDQILNLLRNGSSVVYTWSGNPIEIQEDETLRLADAVTLRHRNEIILDRNSFLSMQQYERINLLTHELFHLTKGPDGHYDDLREYGPFTGTSGGRRLLNSLGAATSLNAYKYGAIYQNQAALNRSSSNRHIWLGVSLLNGRSSDADAHHMLKGSHTTSFAIEARYQPSWYGVYAKAFSLSREHKTGQSITSFEEQTIFTIGGSYRHHFFSDRLTMLGQSHLILQLGYVFGKNKLTISDSTVGFTDAIDTQGTDLSVSYNFPLQKGLWIKAELGSIFREYKYETPNYRYTQPLIYTTIGVNYGF